MKKILKSFLAFAIAGMAFTACSKDNITDSEINTTGKIIKASASAIETRVVVDTESSSDSKVVLNWAEGDKLDIHGFTGTTYKSSVAASDYTYEEKNIEFSFNEVADADTYYASHPAEAVIVNSSYNEFVINIPATQTPTQDFVDPLAVLMLSDAVAYNEGDTPNFALNHMAAYAKMLVKANEAIQSVEFTSNATTNEKGRYGISGQYWKYYGADATPSEPGTANYTSNSIQITAPEGGFAEVDGYYTVWFTLIPQDITSFSVKITTANGSFSKDVNIDGAPLVFNEGKAKSFKIDMTNAKLDEPVTYNLVSNIKDIEDGYDYIFLATCSNNDGTFTIPNALATNGINGVNVESTDFVIDESSITTKSKDYSWKFTGTANKMAVTSVANEGYLSQSSGTTMVVSTKESDWSFTFDNGIFLCKNNTADRNMGVFHSTTNGSHSWRLYSTNQSGVTFNIKIYKNGPVTEPEKVPSLTLGEKEVNAEAKDNEIFTISYEITNPIEGEEVKAVASENWIDDIFVNDDDNEIWFSVEDNEGTTREATITVTYATAEPQTIIVKQAAAEGVASEYTDILDVNNTTTASQYTNWTYSESTSGAEYKGYSMKGTSNSIQINSKNGYGIITTKSGGKVKSIAITFASGSNKLNIYGKNSAYETTNDLYSTDKQGELLGSLSSNGTIIVDGDYEYVGFVSDNNAIYISKIEITWSSDGSTGGGTTEPEQPEQPGGDSDTETEYELTLTAAVLGFTGTSYSFNGSHNVTATATDNSGKTFNVSINTNQLCLKQNSTDMQWQKNTGTLYNETSLGAITSLKINGITGGTFTVYEGTSSSPSTVVNSGDVYNFSPDSDYFKVAVGNAAGYLSSIVITFKK